MIIITATNNDGTVDNWLERLRRRRWMTCEPFFSVMLLILSSNNNIAGASSSLHAQGGCSRLQAKPHQSFQRVLGVCNNNSGARI